MFEMYFFYFICSQLAVHRRLVSTEVPVWRKVIVGVDVPGDSLGHTAKKVIIDGVCKIFCVFCRLFVFPLPFLFW